MKPTISAFVLLSTATTALAQVNPTCINADPSSTLAGINGNFELLVDPQDPGQNVIYTNNVATGASSVVVARIDGLSGQVMPGSLHTIANNFLGNTNINGPEFVQPPEGELGILYAGPEGVHGAFRPPNTQVWFNFFSISAACRPMGALPSFRPVPALTRGPQSRWGNIPTGNISETARTTGPSPWTGVTVRSALAYQQMWELCSSRRAFLFRIRSKVRVMATFLSARARTRIAVCSRERSIMPVV